MDGMLEILRVLVSLAVVFGLLWFLARRMRRGSGAAGRRTSTVRVLGKAGVGGKAQVVVVETEGRRMVLGVTEHGVSVLHDADAPPAEPSELGAVTPAASPAASPASPARLAPVVHLPSFESLISRTQWSGLSQQQAPAKRGRRAAGR